MKFHYMGKFDGNYDALPAREHEPGYAPIKGPSPKAFPIIINIIGFILTIALLVPVMIYGVLPNDGGSGFGLTWLILIILAVGVIFPHELLHAICFKDDVYMYTNLKKGICFVIGPELFTKSRLVFMSMLPNIIFGMIPYIIWIIFPRLWYIGVFGGVGVGMGAGDYLNIILSLIQMPKGAKSYSRGFGSFWVMTDKEI